MTAVTISPEYRRLGLAKLLMDYLELCSGEENCYNSYFVDLFVRISNTLAIAMYRRLGYVVYRRVLDYYSGEEDAFGKYICKYIYICLYVYNIIYMYILLYVYIYVCVCVYMYMCVYMSVIKCIIYIVNIILYLTNCYI